MATVLVPVGHVIEASRAVGRVAELADPGVDRVIVLHVHHNGRHPGRLQEEPGRDCIARIVARTLCSAGVRAEALTVGADVSDLAAAIAGVAAETKAGTVVVGDAPTWLSAHQGVKAELQRLLPGTRVVPVLTPS
jgi:hypothetical protein